jgi:hypothetical protein
MLMLSTWRRAAETTPTLSVKLAGSHFDLQLGIERKTIRLDERAQRSKTLGPLYQELPGTKPATPMEESRLITVEGRVLFE